MNLFGAFINAIITLVFYTTVFATGQEVYSYFKKEALRSSQRGLGSMKKFNRKLTQKTYEWEVVK